MRITHSTIEPSYDFNERKKNDTLNSWRSI